LDIIKNNKQLTYFCMYSLVIPADKQVRVASLQDVKDWFTATIKKLETTDIELDRVVLDPGFGFVSSPALSLEIIKNVEVLRSYGVRLMIGHSRKSYLEAITKVDPKDRDIETLAASCTMYGKVDYLRVHNVAIHKRSFEVLRAINKNM